jgi:dynein assembly factor with WDR repeat domains 1
VLPLTNCAFNKNGDKYNPTYLGSLQAATIEPAKYGKLKPASSCTRSRGIRTLSTAWFSMCPTGKERVKRSDRVATGSFDKTAKIWNTDTGNCIYTFAGHKAEVVTISFDPHKSLLATGSMDQTCKLWDLETGKEHSTLKGHEG